MIHDSHLFYTNFKTWKAQTNWTNIPASWLEKKLFDLDFMSKYIKEKYYKKINKF